MKSKREEVIWAAGLFEGEGCIFRCAANGNRSGRDQLPVCLVTTDLDVLERFVAAIGFGKIRTLPLRDERKQAWEWRVAARGQAYAMLAMLYPWLGERRRARARAHMDELTPIGKQGGVKGLSRPRVAS